MVEQVSQNLRDPNNRGFTKLWIGDRLNEAQRALAGAIRQAQANFFKKSVTVAVTVGTEEYDLPLDCPPDGVTAVTPLYVTYPRSRLYISFRDSGRVITGAEKHFSVYHNGRRMRLLLKPTPVEAETVTVVYERSSSEMQYGTPTAMSNSPALITLAATPTMGRTYYEANYPVGCYLLITAGLSKPDIRQITAYNASTRVATVDANWTDATDAANTTYEVMPEWVDDDFADYLIYDATMTGFDRDEEESVRWEKKRAEKLATIKAEVKQLQRVQQYKMVLDREVNRAGRRLIPPGVRIPAVLIGMLLPCVAEALRWV